MLCIARRILIVVSLIAVPTGTAFATTAVAAGPASSHIAAPATDPGDSPRTVKKAQKALIRLGLMAPGSADGIFGETTTAAIRQFQGSRGLTVNGLLDVPTATVLRVIKATTILSKGAKGAEVAAIQTQLLQLGIPIKTCADGVFRKSTVAALKTFQRSMGLRRTGKLDAGTAAILANATAGLPSPSCQSVAALPASVQVGASAMSNECAAVTNAQRAASGVAPLTVNSKLTRAAESHSAYQASIMTMTHEGPGGVDAGTRMRNAGYRWSTWGENVAYGQADCASVIGAWMASDGHRANILNPAFTKIGVAVAVGANGYLYWTMNLAG